MHRVVPLLSPALSALALLSCDASDDQGGKRAPAAAQTQAVSV